MSNDGQIQYVTRRSTDERYKHAYPWSVLSLVENKVVAMCGSKEKADDWAKQLNEFGYVQAD